MGTINFFGVPLLQCCYSLMLERKGNSSISKKKVKVKIPDYYSMYSVFLFFFCSFLFLWEVLNCTLMWALHHTMWAKSEKMSARLHVASMEQRETFREAGQQPAHLPWTALSICRILAIVPSSITSYPTTLRSRGKWAVIRAYSLEMKKKYLVICS